MLHFKVQGNCCNRNVDLCMSLKVKYTKTILSHWFLIDILLLSY